MSLTYYKRFHMVFDLRQLPEMDEPAAGYELLPWSPSLLKAHAKAKYQSFRWELDANVFPCLGDWRGCTRLMTDISKKSGFVPEATWLAVYRPASRWRRSIEHCGTIQGIRDNHGWGAIQNIGVTPEHRGQGIGTALIFRALAGFHEVGLQHAYLEVTADNEPAIRLYERLGFRRSKTLYKAVATAPV